MALVPNISPQGKPTPQTLLISFRGAFGVHGFGFLLLYIRISDDALGDKSVDELTVGIFADILYDWIKSR